jgi:hypothetical protein
MNSTQNNPLDDEDDELNDLSTSVVNQFIAFLYSKNKKISAAYFFSLIRNLLLIHRLLNRKQLIARKFLHQCVKVIVYLS